MAKLTKTQAIRIETLAYVVVARMFATFHNPTMRGENFTWAKFPDLMASYCRNQAMMNSRQVNDDLLNYAEIQGRAVAEELVKLMTD